MTPWFETIDDLLTGAETLARRPYGVIEVVDGRFQRVRIRPWPKITTAPGIMLLGNWYHDHFSGDRLWIYYNQPRRHRNFLALKYMVSTRHTTVGTVSRSLDVLDEIARLKRSDAILCDVGNWRITPKVVGRWGWVPHCPSRFHRHFIKRFYGEYPERAAWIAGPKEKAGLHPASKPRHPDPAVPQSV